MKDYESGNFSVDWFSKRAPFWEKHLIGFRGRPNLVYLEIGAFEGRSLVWVMQNLLTHPSAHAHVIDPFTGSVEHDHDKERFGTSTLHSTFLRNTEPYRDRITVHVGLSHNLLLSSALTGKQFDLIYIDGSHRAYDVFRDGVLAWDLLAPGGVLIFDDYLWETMAGEFQRPKLGVDVFMRFYRRRFRVLFTDYQVALTKHVAPATPLGLRRRLLLGLFYPVALGVYMTRRLLSRATGPSHT